MSEDFQACWFSSYPPASEDDIEALIGRLPWLPSQYLEFLRLSNGCVLEMFVFYGLGTNHPFPASERDFIDEMYGEADWHAIGHDPSGDTFLLHRTGAVATAGSDPHPDEPMPLCEDLRTLIEDICCGPGYEKYFGGRGDSAWCEYLRRQGWLAERGT